MKKILSLVLSAVMLLTGCGILSAAASDTAAAVLPAGQAYFDLSKVPVPETEEALKQAGIRFLWDFVQILVDTVVNTLEFICPTVRFPEKDEYVNDTFLRGMDEFLTEPAAGAVWKIGYGSASLQTGDELDGRHYVGGSLSLDKSATQVCDDQRVRVIALNDGSGRGTVLYAVYDAFGMASGTVAEIREYLSDIACENGVVGINVSALHQHSCVDTFGMNGPLLKMVFFNPLISFLNNNFGTDIATVNGVNASFMDHLYKVTADAVKEALSSMKEGKLYYSKTDAAKYIRDKREPYGSDTDIHRLRFVPDDGSRETWIINSAIHCVGNGAAGTTVTGDYPYYMEKEINERADADFILIQGAELAITSEYDNIEEMPQDLERMEKLKIYGKVLADAVIDGNAAEKEVEPVLNYRMLQYYVPVNNALLSFLGKWGGLTNTVVSRDMNQTYIEVVTEIGYMELGKDLAVAIVPGELEPAIAYGGAPDAQTSWRGTDFDYPTFEEIAGEEKELLVFGLSNDQIGYILADNDYRSMFTENEEIVSTGSAAGSTTVRAFEELVNSVR